MRNRIPQYARRNWHYIPGMDMCEPDMAIPLHDYLWGFVNPNWLDAYYDEGDEHDVEPDPVDQYNYDPLLARQELESLYDEINILRKQPKPEPDLQKPDEKE